MKSACHKGSPRTLKQRPRGSQNGVQMVPKPPKNEIRILTRKDTSKKPSKYKIHILFAMSAAPEKTYFSISFWRPKQAPEPLQKGPVKLLAKRCSLFPTTIQNVTPQGPNTEAKIHQKSHFGASGTPQLQPTGPRDAQEGVHHPNWSQKSSKNDPRTLKRQPVSLKHNAQLLPCALPEQPGKLPT